MDEIPLIVTTSWLAEHLDDLKLRIVDATVFMKFPEGGGPPNVESGKTSYEQGHIPGAVYADLAGELSDPDSPLPFTVPPRGLFIEKLTELGIGDDTYTVVYDQNALVGETVAASYWASRLAWQMRYEGFGRIAILEGGLQKWQAEGRELSKAKVIPPKAAFTGKQRPEMLATKEDVQKAIEDEQTVLIDSLSPEEFHGNQSADPRTGHIPSSRNVFFAIHADEQTKELYDDGKLRASFEQIGALDPDKKVITYCGGGIAATWTALLLNKLGQPNVAVYDGSMNEWASDPSCPVVKSENS
ncbi:thiosulfate sulfurtransferase [Planococcus salinarum]|uniref:Thiosulfate sulfurtransferase n=1 Tax=Planococcus salinarum TaxID=622695 RepID=A0ABX3D1B6_9BACL|nr:sulfurtransferase [Planococcus salinarum]OHX53930.1 thiosulfate sulfurtransferase [Planococcus salinarum]TAA73046.1 sulfurtransferase [Planococcus salinarum]